MRVAVLISGYIRSFELNIQSLNDKILSNFDDVDIFLHITKNEELEDKYYNKVSSKDIEDIKSVINPRAIIEESNIVLFNDTKKDVVYNTWIKYYKLNQLKKEYEKINGKYDLVIKYRPDMNISSDLDSNFENGLIYIPNDSKIDKSKLLNENDPHLCDIFAYGDSESMNLYFDIANRVKDLIEEYGSVPETILYYYLRDYSLKYKLINLDYNIILSKCNIFAICGDSGSGKTTLGNLLKKYFSSSFMFECDRYHKWERGNDNWKLYSHLNPDANYITKMNKDIFDLKIGKDVYQVDYDHKTGRFTDKEKIETTDNIIVCGLHSLYSDNDAVYNLKIFMDTDINLKYSWKVKRDINERGYSLEKVLNQIKDREKDFIEYIYPQRSRSDIVVNFTTDDKFDILNIDKNLNVYLNIYLSRKVDITKIINTFIKYNISFLYSEDENFNKITFMEYKSCELFEFINLNNFYDYLVFIILNIHDKNKKS